jgi:hypothetical protein
MGYESSYQVKIPTNQLNNRTGRSKFSTARSPRTTEPQKINPWFITGFSDAEGCFMISIYKDLKSKLKYRVTASFSIHLHIKDYDLLLAIKETLGVGNVRKNSSKTAIFRVDNFKELGVIVEHFKNIRLLVQKLLTF